MDHEPTIATYFAAMRRGADAAEEMFALFAADAVYAEPFSGHPDPAVGIAAIRERLTEGWRTPLPDFELEVDTVVVEATTARSEWTCHSSAFPGPVRGEDHYTFDPSGKISLLEVRIIERSE